MTCTRCKPAQQMYRVTNGAGTAVAKCNRCCRDKDCAYCPKCGNKTCLSCYNKTVAEKGKPPPVGGPAVTDGFTI